MTNQFVDLPMQKLLNRENIVSRVESLEQGAEANPGARVVQLGQFGSATGNLIVDGQITILGDDGVPNVTMQNGSIMFRNQLGYFGFEDTAGQSTMEIYSDGGNFLVMQNSYGGSGVSFLIDTAAHAVTQIDFTETGIHLFHGTVDIPSGQSYLINGNTVLSETSATWSPTWTNLNVGNGTLTARYTRTGPKIYGELELVFGSTTSISGSVQFSLPVAALRGNSYPLGLVRMVSAGSAFVGVALQASTTNAVIGVSNVSATYLTTSALSSTVPATWTTNDRLQVQFSYFAA